MVDEGVFCSLRFCFTVFYVGFLGVKKSVDYVFVLGKFEKKMR